MTIKNKSFQEIEFVLSKSKLIRECIFWNFYFKFLRKLFLKHHETPNLKIYKRNFYIDQGVGRSSPTDPDVEIRSTGRPWKVGDGLC